jgi:AcrR family transcriptional regulator
MSPHDIVTIQRARIITAALEAVEDVGYAQMTVSQVVDRARISRKTFYELFDDREDCFLAALEQVLAQTRQLAVRAFEAQTTWRDGVRAALAALLDLMDEAPGLARVYVVGALAAGERVLERRAEVLDELAHVIDQGRAGSVTVYPPAITAQGLVGAILSVLHSRLVRDDRTPFRALLGPLMSMIVLPYLGARAASEELVRDGCQDRPARRRRRAARKRAQDPLDGLKMRLTYRTMLVLAVIAEHPGASNRDVAEGAGIVDQGQISKLLSRLASLDLIVNSGAGQVYGAANAWRLTARGGRLEQATRRH